MWRPNSADSGHRSRSRDLAGGQLPRNHYAVVPRSNTQYSALGTRILPVLWRVLWFPFWFGSDLRPPALPRRGMADGRLTVLRRGLEATRFVQWMLEIQDRIWRQRLAADRAARLLAHRARRRSSSAARGILNDAQPAPAAITIPAALICALAIVYAWLQRPTRMGLARFLDQGYSLDATLATSLELAQGADGQPARAAPPQSGGAHGVPHRADTPSAPASHRAGAGDGGSASASSRSASSCSSSSPNDPRPPRLRARAEVAGCQAGAAAERRRTRTARSPTSPDQQLTPEQLQQLAVQSAQAQQDLQRLANSLNDDSATKQAAQDIQNGNYNAAAQDLQQVASNLDQTLAGRAAEHRQRSPAGRQPEHLRQPAAHRRREERLFRVAARQRQ